MNAVYLLKPEYCIPSVKFNKMRYLYCESILKIALLKPFVNDWSTDLNCCCFLTARYLMSLGKSLYGVYKNPQCNWECCLSVVLSAQDTIPNLQDGAGDEDNSVRASRKSIYGFPFLSYLKKKRMKCGVSQEFNLAIMSLLLTETCRLL